MDHVRSRSKVNFTASSASPPPTTSNLLDFPTDELKSSAWWRNQEAKAEPIHASDSLLSAMKKEHKGESVFDARRASFEANTELKPKRGNISFLALNTDSSEDEDDSDKVSKQAITHDEEFGTLKNNVPLRHTTATNLAGQRKQQKEPKQSAHSLESQGSVGSGFSKARSGKSSASSLSETAIGKLLAYFGHMRVKALESDEYRNYCTTVNNAKYQILAVGAAQAVIFISIFYVVQSVIGSVLPSIRFYNFVHAVMALQGKILLLVGWELVSLVKKGFAAVQMQSQKQGVPLSEIAAVDPNACRTVNRIFLICLICVEAAMWTMSYLMDWEPIETDLGNFACTFPSYTQKWNFSSDLNIWVGANSGFGILESYGLPLQSGLLGGMCAIPNNAPNRQFQMKGPGVSYLIESVCTDALVSLEPPTTKTTSTILSSDIWGQIFNIGIELRFPAGSHNWFEYSDNDVIQKCQVLVVTGSATITFSYTSDEWGHITPASIQEIIVNNELTVAAGASTAFDFGLLHQTFGDSELLYENVTQWIAQGAHMVLNSTNLENTNSLGTGSTLLTWGLDAKGLYDPTMTWKGLAAAVAMVGHYVLDKSDNTLTGMCAYKGVAGYGTITAPPMISTALLVILICSIAMEVAVVFSWLLIVGGGLHIDQCVAMIDNPLRTLYYMRGCATRLITKLPGHDLGQTSLLQHFDHIYVRFGEDKKTRGNEVGTVVVDEPSKVVKISKKRTVV